jgi:hypothetical protein
VADDVEWILLGRGFDEVAIAAETVVWAEDGGFVNAGGVGALWFSV